MYSISCKAAQQLSLRRGHGRYTDIGRKSRPATAAGDIMNTHFRNRRNRLSNSKRSDSAQAIAESGPILWALFIGLSFPAICLASMCYRSVFAYYATRDCCARAAKAATYTAAAATATSTFGTDISAFPGVSGTPTTYIVEQPLAGGNPNVYTAPMTVTAPNTTNYVYFIQVVVPATISPLFTIGPGWNGPSVPGLTGAFSLRLVATNYAENPQGLAN